MCNLHFCLHLGQFLTDFQNSFFLWKLMKIAIWLESGCAIAHLAQPAHPLPPPLFSLVGLNKWGSIGRVIRLRLSSFRMPTWLCEYVQILHWDLLGDSWSLFFHQILFQLRVWLSCLSGSDFNGRGFYPLSMKNWSRIFKNYCTLEKIISSIKNTNPL